MSDQVTISGSIAIKRATTALTAGIALTSKTFDMATPTELDASQKTLSTSFSALDFDEVSISEATWAMFLNPSTTDAEIVTLSKLVLLADGFSEDATPTIAGASVPATLPAAGKYRTISADGTSQSIAWKVGDRAVYLGASGSYGRIPLADIMKIKAGYAVGPIQLPGDAGTLYAKSASGVPQIAWVVAGALV